MKFTLSDLRGLIRKLDNDGLDTSLLKAVSQTLGHRKWGGNPTRDIRHMAREMVDDYERPMDTVTEVSGISNANFDPWAMGSEDLIVTKLHFPLGNSPAVGVLMSALKTIAEMPDDPSEILLAPVLEMSNPQQFSVDDESVGLENVASTGRGLSRTEAAKLNDRLLGNSHLFPGYQVSKGKPK